MFPVCCRSDFVTSYFLAFSNDSREWTTIHDGYANWVSSPKTAPIHLAQMCLGRKLCPLLCCLVILWKQ